MPERKPSVSVIVPVLHEQDRIRAVVEHVLSLPAPGPIEVLAVDGDPGGSTLCALGKDAATGLIAGGGRAGQMNAGANRAQGDVLVFLHADTQLPERAFFLIHEALFDPGFDAGAFDLAFDSGRLSLRIVAFTGRLRSRITRIPFGDQAQFFRREFFHKLGGFADIPLMEDVEIMRRTKKQGGKIRILRDKAVTSPRRYETEGVWRRTFGNWTLQFRYLLGASPALLAEKYRARAKEGS